MKQPSQATRRLIALVITIAMVLMSFSSILAATEAEAANTSDFVPGTIEGDDSIDPNSDVMILCKSRWHIRPSADQVREKCGKGC